MSFFESIPAPIPEPPSRPPRPAWARSEAVIPGSVPAELIVARTEQAAIAVGSVRAYPNGFEFTAHVRLCQEDQTGGAFIDPFDLHRTGRNAPPGGLRLGVMYADGRRAATTGPALFTGDPGWLVLQPDGGGGNGLSYDQDFWVHPLPPPGPVTLVVSWLAYGIAEVRAELDGTAIAAAARRSVTLWPDEPETA